MVKRDVIGSLAWMGFGSIFAVSALQQGLFAKGLPGPGLLPFISGVALIAISLFVLVPALYKADKGHGNGVPMAPGGLKKAVLAIIALLAYSILLEPIGYLIVTFAFILFATRLMAKGRWWVSVTVAAVASAASYVLFVVLLSVSLPKGLLAFI